MKKSKPANISLSSQLFIITLLLLVFGIVMIYSASVAEALRDFGDKYHFVKLQARWGIIGVIAMLIVSRINLKLIEKLAPYAMIFAVITLIAVLIPGIGLKVQGARRWILFPGFVYQPSELTKLIEIIYLSSWLNSRKVYFSQFLFFLIFISGLILLQPDMGTTLVVASIAVALYFISDYPISHILGLGVAGIISSIILIISAPYRAARLATFLNPTLDPQGSSYHIRQILLALGSGGIFGTGIGRSRQKYEYLPESTTDSIFAVVGEEVGFLGSMLLIIAFAYLIYLIFKIAIESRSKFNRSLAGGIGVWISLQTVMNLSSMVALTPLTGIPLPLISYGGSSLLSMLMGIGIVLNIARSEKL